MNATFGYIFLRFKVESYSKLGSSCTLTSGKIAVLEPIFQMLPAYHLT